MSAQHPDTVKTSHDSYRTHQCNPSEPEYCCSHSQGQVQAHRRRLDDELNLQVPFWCSPDRRPSESSHKDAGMQLYPLLFQLPDSLPASPVQMQWSLHSQL